MIQFTWEFDFLIRGCFILKITQAISIHIISIFGRVFIYNSICPCTTLVSKIWNFVSYLLLSVTRGPPTQTPTQNLKNRFLISFSHKIGLSLVWFWMIIDVLQSEDLFETEKRWCFWYQNQSTKWFQSSWYGIYNKYLHYKHPIKQLRNQTQFWSWCWCRKDLPWVFYLDPLRNNDVIF